MGMAHQRRRFATKDSPASVTVSLFFRTLFPMRSDSLYNNCQNSRFQTEEEPLHNAQILITGIQDAQDQHCNEPGNDKERSGYDAPWNFVQQPTDVDGELLRFRTREEACSNSGHGENGSHLSTVFLPPNIGA